MLDLIAVLRGILGACKLTQASRHCALVRWCHRYLTIRQSNVCRAFHGSLRAFIEDNARAPMLHQADPLGPVEGIATGGVAMSDCQTDVDSSRIDREHGVVVDGVAASMTALRVKSCCNDDDGSGGGGGVTGEVFPDCSTHTVDPMATAGATAAVTNGRNTGAHSFAWRPTSRDTFGVAYLDYCSSLYSGQGTDVEKSPLRDIEALFARGTLDPKGALLAVTVAVADDGPAAAVVDADLIAHVTKHAVAAEFKATPTREFRFSSTLVRFFNCAAAADIEAD
jgi:hypothetical protein